MADTPKNRGAAQLKAALIEEDIYQERFDQTLAKYKPPRALSLVDDSPPSSPQVSLTQLWESYSTYKKPQVSQSTFAKDFKKTANHIKGLPTDDLSNAVAIRDYIVDNLSPNAAKRLLVQLNACCNWAISSRLIEFNSFKGMARDIKLGKVNDADINPFTASEKEAIIKAFEQHKNYNYYTAFVKFLFATGCRPSEAVALQWGDIDLNKNFLTFQRSYTISEDGLKMKQGLKTQKKRKFPFNEGHSLKLLLESIKPENPQPEKLVFPSPTGKVIDFHNFNVRAWNKILEGLPDIKYRKPYQTRHTFITLAINEATVSTVARLVGNSPEMIFRHYVGNTTDIFAPDV